MDEVLSDNSVERFAELNKCDDELYADEVATFLVNNRAAAEAIINAQIATMLCDLQPNPHTLQASPHSYNEINESDIHQVYSKIWKKRKVWSAFVITQ